MEKQCDVELIEECVSLNVWVYQGYGSENKNVWNQKNCKKLQIGNNLEPNWDDLEFGYLHKTNTDKRALSLSFYFP